jgi:multidrug resistance efflux pump
MALLNTFHTSEFREGWGATLRSGPARSFARQSLRLAILLALLVTGLLFLYFKAFRNASLEGVVNAPKYVVRAPIEGIFRFEGLSIGTPLAAGVTIGTITNDRLDDRLEAELSMKVSRLSREMAAQEVIRNEIAAIRERLASRLNDLREINIRKYEEVTDQTMDRATRLQIIAESSHQDLQRFAILARAGVEAPVRIEEYRRAYIEHESESRTAARVASLSLIDKEAAKKGYFLGDAVWDVPYTQQRLDEIDVLSQHLRLRAQVLEAELTEASERLTREKSRLAQQRQADVRSQSPAVVNALFAGNGFEVIKGDPLVEILDTSRTYVEATFPESKYEHLRRGGEVAVKFAGSAARLRGTIVFVQGPGAIDQTQANGARLRSVAKDELVLKVAIEAADLQRAYGPMPQIGRRAQILFD